MRHRLLTLAAAGALFASVAPHAPSVQAAAAAQAPAGPARVIVKFKADSPLMRRHALSASGAEPMERAQALGTRLGVPMRSGAAIDGSTQVVFADGMTSDRLAAQLAQQADVDYAVVDQRRRRFSVPNDALYASGGSNGPVVGQWYLKPPSTPAVSSIDAQAAWDVTTGNPDLVVAVLDTGVVFDHEDLKRVADGGNLLPGYDMISDVPTANDGDGRDANAADPGDWVTAAEATTNPDFEGCFDEPSSWHGTQTAGVLGALTNNGTGMASVGRNVLLLPVRVLGKCGGFDSDIIAGMRWAAGLDVPGVPRNQNPASVINLSLGGTGSCSGTGYPAAIAAVQARGVVVVASAGNSTGHAVSVPANCSGVIGVAAVRHIGTKVGFSDVGPEISLSAPGGNCVNDDPLLPCLYPILTTTNAGTQGPAVGDSSYTDHTNYSVGTSFAAPLVAGTAALMLSVQPELTPAEVRSLLRSTARAFPSTGADTAVQACHAPNAVEQLECYCTTTTCGAGLLDAGQAVLAAAGPQARMTVSPASPQPSQPVALSAATSLASAGGSIVSYAWSADDPAGIVSGFTANGATASLTPLGPGTVTVTVTLVDNLGGTSTVSETLTVAAPPTASDGGGGALGLPWLLLLGAAVVAVAATRRRPG